jgi:predicted metal-dependent phosphotriesterase family hydrolase
VISDGAPTGTLTTVLGNIDARNLGRTDYHEHLFQVTPLLPGDELDDEDASRQEAALLRESGFDGMIDATPTGLCRNPAAVARISRATGLHVVATTGGHRETHYAPGHWLLELSSGELANRFTDDVQVGMPVHDASGSAELVRSAESGATDRLMICGDVARRTRHVAYGGRPGLAYVGRRVVPRLVQAGYGDLVEAVLVRNPARYLSTASRSANRGVRETLHRLLRSAEED